MSNPSDCRAIYWPAPCRLPHEVLETVPAMTSLDVPIIDLGSENDRAIATAIEHACRHWGFFQVQGHGVPLELSQNLKTAMARFFAQPSAQKNTICRTADNPWGFFDAELTKNVRDWKEIYDVGPVNGVQQPQWPTAPEDFREVIETYSAAAKSVARQITEILLKNLGDSTGRELDGFKDHTSFLRLNYYPTCPNPAPGDVPMETQAQGDVGRLGISHHTDAGALTVLQQIGPESLQVLKDKRWHTVPVLADALVINIGDVAQVWSNDFYPAPLHRVLANQNEPRFSAAYFYNPGYDYNYAPLDSSAPAAYRSINWGEFRSGRAAGDYADQGEEIQISSYRRNSHDRI